MAEKASVQTPELIAATVLTTLIVIGVAGGSLAQIEQRFIHRSSNLTAKPRWFTVWLLLFPLWAVIRSMLIGHVDWDVIITTLLWSGVPFFVENLLKSQTSAQMNMLTDLVVAIKQAMDDSEKRDSDSAQRDTVMVNAFHVMLDVLHKMAKQMGVELHVD